MTDPQYSYRKALGKRLASLRNERDLSQEGIARKLKIKRSRWGSYEEGRAEPPLFILQKIVNIFNLTLDELIAIPE